MDRHFGQKLRFILMVIGQDFIVNGRDFHDIIKHNNIYIFTRYDVEDGLCL